MTLIEILYEDNHSIAVWKPAGVLVEGDITGDESLFDQVKKYIKEKYNKPGNVFLGLVHRIDRPVSGIVLFAKTSKGASRFSEQFRNGTVDKTYQALVEDNDGENNMSGQNSLGNIGQHRHLSHFMSKKEGDIGSVGGVSNVGISAHNTTNKRTPARALISNEPFPGSVHADLSYTVLKRYEAGALGDTIKNSPKCALVEIQLETGRYHQIRAQFSHIGHPLVGDRKYGAQEVERGGKQDIALSAVSLAFDTATSGERITLSHKPHFTV